MSGFRARAFARIAALSVLVFAATLGATASAEAKVPHRGVQLHSLWPENSTADMNRQLDLSKAAGSTTIRLDVAWGSLEEAGKGKINSWYTDRLDHVINGAAARGMKVLATFWTTPCWASTAPDTLKQGCRDNSWWNRQVHLYPPANNADFANMAKWFTARYTGKLAAVELWNEPNHPNGDFWKASDEAGAYASLVKAAYPAVKAADSSVPVLAGALSSTDRAFMQKLYDKGIKGSFDAVSIHPYADEDFPQTALFHKMQLANGDNSKLWLTEFGWPTGQSGWHVSETVQAAKIRTAFAQLDATPWIAAAMVYNLRNVGTDPNNMNDNFGLVHRDYSPKPAYHALKDALGAPTSAAAAIGSPSAATAARPATTTRRPATSTSSRRKPLRLRLRHRGSAVYVRATGPAGRRVSVRTTGCALRKKMRVKLNRRGSVERKLGTARQLKGCRVTARMA